MYFLGLAHTTLNRLICCLSTVFHQLDLFSPTQTKHVSSSLLQLLNKVAQGNCVMVFQIKMQIFWPKILFLWYMMHIFNFYRIYKACCLFVSLFKQNCWLGSTMSLSCCRWCYLPLTFFTISTDYFKIKSGWNMLYSTEQCLQATHNSNLALSALGM